YFDRLYARCADPWDFETSPYEAAKYAATLAALPRPRYANPLELGCSIGVLTQLLAQRCERLLATDVSEAALAQARVRCADLPRVIFDRRDISANFPDGRFDLILISEVGYYFSPPDLESLRAKIATVLAPRGHLLLVHYTGETNYPLAADAVHETFLAWKGRTWSHLKTNRSDRYRLDMVENMAEKSEEGICDEAAGQRSARVPM
nr:class I SAM-dependent methyltransferase [Pyrinomonadaceae bacterium]